MVPPLLQHLPSGVLPEHCEPSSPLLTAISSHLHICLPTPLALISSVLGILSIVSWLFAQLPQIYKNYQLQSTSGLSIFFLIIWCAGDASNLVGALFTRQAGWQVIVASYYVFVDLALVIQFFWYTHYKSRHYGGYPEVHHHEHYHDSDPRSAKPLPGPNTPQGPVNITHKHPEVHDMGVQTGSTLTSTPGRSTYYTNEKRHSRPTRLGTSATSPPFALPRTMLLASLLCAVVANASPAGSPDPHPPIYDAPRETIIEVIGRIISWLSTLLYLGSRPPQLYKNYLRKSTEGLSPLLFMAAFSGNFFYSASLATNPNAWSDFPPYGGGGWADFHGNDRWEWIGRSLPFFLGAFGVLGLDGFMGVQFLMYGADEEVDDQSFVSSDEMGPKRGRSRWRRVRGWMRGWIPSASPVRVQNEREGQALLGADQGRYGTV
ncbi:hypothetical protein N7468_002584 [Penicillium chermesinum]|uniref:PQ loop repeat protein n=1 Tax=Penicillium chermesinum TaxID=63820 RepID=A0A9W9PKF5_9EURO|nr:uncharacterized protein N7468_002584 [Penicillium chermesinum]KAJ5247601.1 hypothetical protein N7468_002584 [Penicillium chermesinum]KAJ6145838.1 hypothetical protein N7470_009733 [Penicillium chermesinum]